MKKIFFYTFFLIFVPFFIISLFSNEKIEKKEISLNYISNKNIRVKRLKKDIIEVIPLEEYIVGVLAGEMPIYFDIEALKAQAVASRSYALKRIEYNKDKEYDVVDSTLNQVYLDLDYLKETWKDNYTENINKLRKAVNETLDEYLEYDGKVVEAMFFSTSNGYTEDSSLVFNLELPYLKSVESNWDINTSSSFYSEMTFSLSDFYNKLDLEYNNKLNVEILEKSKSNRVLKLKINNKEFKGRDLYTKLSLKSTDFQIVQEKDKVIFKMKGYGHGVGMSQYGALGMALEGYNYEEILKHYYVEAKLKKNHI